MIAYLLNKIKSVILGALNLISKILCCIKKRRRSSDLGIPVNNPNATSKFSNEVGGETNWDDWDSCEVVIDKSNIPEAPKTTSDHIAAYRQHVAVARQNSVTEEEKPEEDLFSDMAPEIKKQKKVFVGKESPSQRQSRLSAQNVDPIITMGAELGNWGDQNTGWEAEDEDLIDVLKEQKKAKR